MKTMKRIWILLCVLALVLPVSATEVSTEIPTEMTEPPTLPPLVVGVCTLSEIPESWNPLEVRTGDQNAILELLGEPLYRICDGAVVSAQASSLPVDVTAEFAGRYHIPAHATRGYAYAITLREGAFWDNGRALTLSDWVYTVEKLLDSDLFPLEIANYRAYARGDTAPAEEIVSLMDAGYNSVEEAEQEGIFDFYVDTTYFWGLDTGWRRSTDRTRLFDEAIPSGCEEMYVTPAYLYREYLGKTGTQTMFQSEFVGIPVRSGEKMTMNDVGLFVDGDRLVIVLQAQTTATHLALVLSDFYPVPSGTNGNGQFSSGPYSVAEKNENEILLVPNPYWTGEAAEFEQVLCRVAS